MRLDEQAMGGSYPESFVSSAIGLWVRENHTDGRLSDTIAYVSTRSTTVNVKWIWLRSGSGDLSSSEMEIRKMLLSNDYSYS